MVLNREEVPAMSTGSKDQALGEGILLLYSLLRVLLATLLIIAWQSFACCLPLDPFSRRLVDNILLIGVVFSVLLTDKNLTRYLR
jgi:hypothetical protein